MMAVAAIVTTLIGVLYTVAAVAVPAFTTAMAPVYLAAVVGLHFAHRRRRGGA